MIALAFALGVVVGAVLMFVGMFRYAAYTSGLIVKRWQQEQEDESETSHLAG